MNQQTAAVAHDPARSVAGSTVPIGKPAIPVSTSGTAPVATTKRSSGQ
jgi:hypothetical protein